MLQGLAGSRPRPATAPDAAAQAGPSSAPQWPATAPVPQYGRPVSPKRLADDGPDARTADEAENDAHGVGGADESGAGGLEPVPDHVLSADIDDLCAGLGEDDLNDFDMDDFGDGREVGKGDEEDCYADDPFFTPAADIPAVVGFSTGAGKTLKGPSADALARVRKLFDDEQDLAPLEEAKRRRTSEAPATPARVPAAVVPHLSAVLPAAARAAEPVGGAAADGADEAWARTPASGSGFHKANGQAVSAPSASSRARAMAIFMDEPAAGPSRLPQTPATAPSSGFQTGLGRSAPAMTASSRAQALALFGDEPGPSTQPMSMSTPSRPRARAFQTPSASTPSRAPLRTTTNMSARPAATPRRIEIKGTPTRRIGLGSTPGRTAVKKGFVTPFKMGATLNRVSSLRAQVATPPPLKPPADPVFDMTPPAERKGMRAAFLYPQFNSISDLREMGIPDEIWQLDLSNAVHYQFIGEDAAPLGTAQALSKLKHDGCSLATAKWVENHWALILWKLAGQVAARSALFDERWNWFEVVAQLKYRYEREFNLAQRPILRRILEHDSSPALPMVLCVSQIHRPPPVADKDGSMVPQRPFIDLTDGWYRVQAQLDECLVRAVERGRIAVGRKLAMSGAKLVSADSAEALDAYDIAHLVLSGNSCHLARWDARLGLLGKPFVANLSSLSPDGGVVVLLDIVVDKVFPLGFLPAERGNREVPWTEEEEEKRADQWMEQYDAERARLQERCEKQLERVQDLAQLLASFAEDAEGDGEDMAIDVDADYDALLRAADASVRLRTMSSGKVCALARHAAQRLNEDAAAARAGMEAELGAACPPREIRSMRMVRVHDAQRGVREPTRDALINVWDARELTIKEGARYLVSSLVPGRQGDWRVTRERTQLFLHTRRETRWHHVEAAEAGSVAYGLS